MICRISEANAVPARAGGDGQPIEPRDPQPLQPPSSAGAHKWHPEHITLLAVGIVLAIAIVIAAYVLRNSW